MFKRTFILLLTLLLIVLLCGCSAQLPVIENDESAGSSIKSVVTVVITRDFGKKVLLEQTVEIEPDTNAMDALQRVADVETKYGGGFIRAINGIGSEYEVGSERDWFFYINGIQSNIGALDYKLHDGDIQHWDFHDWSFRQFIPAIIGDFP